MNIKILDNKPHHDRRDLAAPQDDWSYRPRDHGYYDNQNDQQNDQWDREEHPIVLSAALMLEAQGHHPRDRESNQYC